MTALPTAPGTAAITGDWHGNLRGALDRIDDARLAGATTIVHLGDFGSWATSAPGRPRANCHILNTGSVISDDPAATMINNLVVEDPG